MYRTALRNVLAHKGRLLMTALAVMLGTAFVAGTMVFSDTAGQAMRNSYSKSYTDISVLVSDNTAGPYVTARDKSEKAGELDQAAVAGLAALPGAQSARGVVTGFTGVADRKGNLIGEAWSARGANFAPDAAGKDPRYPLADGRGPKAPGEIALDEATADKGGYKVGDTVRIAGNGPVMDATLTGVFTTNAPEVTSGGTLVLMETGTAQKWLLEPGRFSSVELAAKPGVAESDLKDQVAQKLGHPNQFRVETGQQLDAEQSRMIADSTTALKTTLLVFAGISLFVGIFIIANTFTMLIAQRIKELALLRAVGAARGQVTRSVLVEALVIGVTASVAGLLTGVGIGAGMQAGLAALNPSMPTGSLVIAPATIVTGLTVGILVTVVSAVLPAIRASRIPPVAAMSSGEQPATQKSLVIRNVIGSLIAGGGIALILLGAKSGKDGRELLEAGAPITLIGIFILLPLLSRPVIALVGPVMSRLFGTAGRLARLNAVRNPRRTAATAAALTIGLTLVSALTVLGASVNDAVSRAVTGSMKADYDVAMAGGAGHLSPEVAGLVAKAPGVAASSPVANVYWDLDGRTRAIQGFDAGVIDQLVKVTMDEGSTAALKQGQILVNDEVAKTLNLKVGSTMKAEYPDETKGTLTVGGVFQRTETLSPILMANAEIAKHDPEPYLSDIMVKGTDGAGSALKQSLKDATGNNPVIEVKSKQDMKDDFSRQITFVLNLMYGLLAMSVLVAVLGVINTLAMSVFERKREIGMLRAIGLDRRGIKRMVRLESVVISVFGAVIGVGLGCFVAWAANQTIAPSMKGLTTVIPYGQMMIFLALAALVGVVAAMWPARRASRLDILDSIKTD
ncbi:ABC transporter permease [Kitasatospora camelliae]|uniref:FtsX-like permease family protein n=1 Tax=Kitasatospora camelliae TaxID=3156397 RepID=A0AAU8JZ96_9ACTN